MWTDHLAFVTRLVRSHGKVFKLPFQYPTFFLSDPDDIRHVLVTNHKNYQKSRGLRIARSFLGTGLISSDEPKHSHMRQLMQPCFSRERIDAMGKLMRLVVEEHLEHNWCSGKTIDTAREFAHMSLAIATRILFGKDLSGQTDTIQKALTACQRYVEGRVRLWPFIPEHWPLPVNVRYRNAVSALDHIAMGLIRDRRNSTDHHDDLLATLINGRGEDGELLSDQQIRDEVVTMLLAGHETTANALTWTFYLLSQHPEAERQLHAEVDSLYGSCVFDCSVATQLPFTAAIVSESMRLYPPVWRIGRRAICPDSLPSGVNLPGGSELIILISVVHRDPDLFSEPDLFRPERFLGAAQKSRFSFFPFGGGPRTCIGEEFARLEAVILLATVGARYRLSRRSRRKIRPEPLITLRPGRSVRMELRARFPEKQQDKSTSP
jgi:cytochrome P450